MAIESFNWKDKDTVVLHLRNLLPYGELDRFWDVTITRNPQGRWNLETITREEIKKLPSDYAREVHEARYIEIPTIGTIVVIVNLDLDYSSSSHRPDGHTVIRGPLLLVD